MPRHPRELCVPAMVLLLLFLLLSGYAHATSAQIEMADPVLPCVQEKPVHGTAFFGLVPGSDLYDTAGNLGATFELAKKRASIVYFTGDLFTYIKNPGGTHFEPRRIIYTLEPGVAVRKGSCDVYRLFIKHQSYHDVDFTDGINESYELYGLGYCHGNLNGVHLSVGKYLNRKAVDYDWDLAAAVTIGLGKGIGGDVYTHLWVHRVTESSPPAGRDGFTDYAAELGVKYISGITLFGRLEHLHDLDRFAGRTESHGLTGLKYEW